VAEILLAEVENRRGPPDSRGRFADDVLVLESGGLRRQQWLRFSSPRLKTGGARRTPEFYLWRMF
jgi:hypothetical protein